MPANSSFIKFDAPALLKRSWHSSSSCASLWSWVIGGFQYRLCLPFGGLGGWVSTACLHLKASVTKSLIFLVLSEDLTVGCCNAMRERFSHKSLQLGSLISKGCRRDLCLFLIWQNRALAVCYTAEASCTGSACLSKKELLVDCRRRNHHYLKM